MTLGTDIVVAAFHHPVRLAEDVAMLDVMSNGRVVLGIAIGYKPDEFALYGVPLEKRGARFEEQLAIMTGLWTQEKVSFKQDALAADDPDDPYRCRLGHQPRRRRYRVLARRAEVDQPAGLQHALRSA